MVIYIAPLMLSLNAHRVLAYSLLSFTALTITILNALRNYTNFYSVTVYLSKSSRSVLVCPFPPILNLFSLIS